MGATSTRATSRRTRNCLPATGVWQGGFRTVQGPASIQVFMEKAMPGANTAHNPHLLSNFLIDVQGDTATAWSRWAQPPSK